MNFLYDGFGFLSLSNSVNMQFMLALHYIYYSFKEDLYAQVWLVSNFLPIFRYNPPQIPMPTIRIPLMDCCPSARLCRGFSARIQAKLATNNLGNGMEASMPPSFPSLVIKIQSRIFE
jgi:hypothetical protein